MSKRTILVSVLSCLLILGVAMPELCLGYHGGSKGKGDLESKVSHKAKKILMNKDELGLSADQIKKVNSLNKKVRKDLIKKNAEIDMLKVDIKEQMCADPADKAVLTQLIEKKYDLKKEKSVYLAHSYIDLKNVLNEEQKAKMKDIYRKSVKKHMHKGMMDSKQECPMMKNH
ncbi:MAG: hypothetical protein HQ579_03090 [Candidatus Omnitrophica bacterium]|nr:hypothetical protein [Candidatus Omnitrophota bacterium]